MDEMNFVKRQSYGGLDWHDSHSETHMVLQNETCDLQDVKKAIFDDILLFQSNNSGMDKLPVISMEELDKVYQSTKEEPYEYVLTSDTDETSLVISRDKEYGDIKIIASFAFGQITYTYWYIVKNIPREYAVFMPIFGYIRGTKAGDTQERLFCEPFKTETEAIAYIKQFQANQDWVPDYKEVIPCDSRELQGNMFYQANLAINQRMQALDLDCQGKYFRDKISWQNEELDKYIAEKKGSGMA